VENVAARQPPNVVVMGEVGRADGAGILVVDRRCGVLVSLDRTLYPPASLLLMLRL
jgi:hypothetical protein